MIFLKALTIAITALVPSFGFSAEPYNVCSVELTYSDDLGHSVHAVCDGVTIYSKKDIQSGHTANEFTKAMAEALSQNEDFRIVECEIEDQQRVCIIAKK